MENQWCPRERPLEKIPEGVYRDQRGLSKASFTWKDPSDTCKLPFWGFPWVLSLRCHWLFIAYMVLHVFPIFEHHAAFLFVVTYQNKVSLLFFNSCATVISAGFCHKVECHKLIFWYCALMIFTLMLSIIP